MPRRALFLALLAGLPCCEPPPGDDDDTPEPPPPPGETGPYVAGATTLSVTVPTPTWPDRELNLWVWYPARPTAGAPLADYLAGWTHGALAEATPDRRGAPYPLVAFSHGYSGFAAQSAFLTEHLATRGFVVVAPDHAGNTLFDDDVTEAFEDAMNRPGDVVAAIDAVLAADEPLAGLVDPERMAVAGHSFGAWTSLVLAGVEVSMDVVRAECGASCPSLEGLPESGYHSFFEPRLRAALPLTPGVRQYFGSEGTGHSQRPVLIVAAGADETLPAAEEARPIFEELVPPAAYYEIAGAGHFSFSHMCDLFPGFGDGCGVGFLDVNRVFELTVLLADSFFGYHLQDPAAYVEFPACTDWPEVSCETRLP